MNREQSSDERQMITGVPEGLDITQEKPRTAQANTETLADVPRSASEYMDQLDGEILGKDFRVGWSQLDKRGMSRGGEDTVYAFADRELDGGGTFAVFDGAGGSGDGRTAAYAALETLHRSTVNNEGTIMNDPVDSLESLFDSISHGVAKATSKGYTTGIVGIIQRSSDDGQRYFHWGAVGDSLGYIVNAAGQVTQLNEEETMRQALLNSGAPAAAADKQGNVITNALGDGQYDGLEQHGSFALQPGDRILLTSDGITGDRADQRLSGGGSNEAVIAHILAQRDLSPFMQAQALIEAATKNDDRTALVIQI